MCGMQLAAVVEAVAHHERDADCHADYDSNHDVGHDVGHDVATK